MSSSCKEVETMAAWQTSFVPPTFHIVLPIILYMIIKHKVLRKLTWLVDIFASGFLLYGTYGRRSILDGQKWTHNCAAAVTSDYKDISKYFVLSIASWLSIAILDGKTCMYICKAVFGKYKSSRSGVEWLKFIGYFFLAANSVVIMLHFCTDVHQTFEHLTKETWLILYYWVAASLKVASVFIQGVFFCSWIIDHPVCFLAEHKVKERKLMFRMAFVNAVGVCHTLGLTYFHVLNGNLPWTFEKKIRVFFLLVDFVYRLVLCWWYGRNSHCCLLPQTYHIVTRLLETCALSLRTCYEAGLRATGECYHFLNARRNIDHEGDNDLVPPLMETAPILVASPVNELVMAGRATLPHCTYVYYGGRVTPGASHCYVITLKTAGTIAPPYLFRRVAPMNCNGELAIHSLPSSVCLIMPSWSDHRHLLSPYFTSDTFPRSPCVQEAQYHVSEEMVI